MANKIMGITIDIEGRTSGLTKSLQEANSQINKTSSALKDIDKALKLDPKNVDLIAQKEALLAKQIDQTNSKLEIMEQVAKDANEALERGDISQEQYASLTAEISKTNSELDDLKDSAKHVKDVGDEAEESKKGVNGLAEAGEKVGDALKKGAEIGVKALAAVGTAATVALVASGKALYDISKEVVSSYADLEQALGGSEAVFGDFAESIQAKAEESYKTLGTSEEQYLAYANKIGALFQGSGVELERSADLTTAAMERAADMASVMGIDTQTALDAIAGAAKGNYAMMDNLGISMNNTTLEAYAMAQGFDTAWKDMSKAEQAEVAMQYFFEQTSKYAGNFQNEATETIAGSMGMLESSWSSFIAGLGNQNADIANLTDNVIDSFVAVTNNIIPIVDNMAATLPMAIEQAITSLTDSGILDSIISAAEIILDTLLSRMGDILPQISDFALRAVDMLASTLMKNQNMLKTTISTLLNTLVQAVIKMLPVLIPLAIDALDMICDTILSNLDLILDAAFQIISAITTGLLTSENIQKITTAAFQIIQKLAEFLLQNLSTLIQAGIDLLISLANGFAEAAPELIPVVVDAILLICQTLLKPNNLSMLLSATLDVVLAVAQALLEATPEILSSIFTIVGDVVSWLLTDGICQLADAGYDLICSLVDKVPEAIGEVIAGITNVCDEILKAFGFEEGLGKGLTDVWNGIWNMIKGVINTVIGGINGMISAVESAINFIIDAINSLSWEIPDWVPLVGGETFGFDIPRVSFWKIPELAEGAVIPPNNPFLAVLGDQSSGTNIEAPLDTIKQALQEAMVVGGGQPQVINVYIGQEKIETMVAQANTNLSYISGGR